MMIKKTVPVHRIAQLILALKQTEKPTDVKNRL